MEPSADPSEQTRNPASNSEAFAELSRLARESTSSWSENTPGRNTDRAFLLLIVIAIFLLSAIIMITSYRQQLSEKFDELIALTSHTDSAGAKTSLAAPTQTLDRDGSGSSALPSSIELELKVKNLEERMALLQQQLARLETSPRSPASAPAAQAILDVNAQTQDPATVLTETEPAQVPANTLQAPASQTADTATPFTREAKAAGESAPPAAPVGRETDRDSTPAVTIKPEPAAGSKAVVTTETAGTALQSKSAALDGDWYINLAAYSQEAAAKPLYERARKFARADIEEVISGSRTVYRVRAVGYPSPQAARKDAQRLESLLNLKGTWVSDN